MSCVPAAINAPTPWGQNWALDIFKEPSCCKEEQSDKSTLFGYDVKVISDHFETLSLVTSMTETFHSVVKFMACFASAASPKFVLDKLSFTMVQVDNWIDGLRFVADFQQAIKLEHVSEFLAKRYYSVASGICFFFADFGSSMNLLGAIKMIDVDAILLLFGSVRVFGLQVTTAIGHLVVGTYSLEIQTCAFVFLGIQKGIDFANGDCCKRNILWVITCIWEVVHKSFLFFSGSILLTPPGIVIAGVLGMVANGFGIWSAYEDVIEEKRSNREQHKLQHTVSWFGTKCEHT